MNSNVTRQRSKEELILLNISGAIAFCLLPFALIRLLQKDWAVAILDSIALITALVLFFHVYLTQKTYLARWGMTVMCIAVMTGTIYIKGYEQVLWVYPALSTVFFLVSPHVAATISGGFLFAVLAMIWPAVEPMYALKFTVSAGATLLFCYAFSYRMHQHSKLLSELAITDPLTKVGNRRALEEKLLHTVEQLKRFPEQTSSIIVLDIDLFKSVNDTYGHQCGDQVLRQLSENVKHQLRKTDQLYRFGGEEFVIVLDKTAIHIASMLAEKLRQQVSRNVCPPIKEAVTISAGVAEYLPGESSYEWLARADAALYIAKEEGRNCIRAA